MTLTVGQVLTHARDYHPAFTSQRVPDPVLWRKLTTWRQRLLLRLARTKPEMLGPTAETTVLPLADFAAGVPVAGTVLQPVDAEATDVSSGEAWPVELIPYEARFGRARLPAAALSGQTLFLLGTALDWTGFASVTFRYIGLPGVVTGNDTALGLPDLALDACAAYLADFMANRLLADGTPDPTLSAADFRDGAREALAELLAGVGQRSAAEVVRIVDVT